MLFCYIISKKVIFIRMVGTVQTTRAARERPQVTLHKPHVGVGHSLITQIYKLYFILLYFVIICLILVVIYLILEQI